MKTALLIFILVFLLTAECFGGNASPEQSITIFEAAQRYNIDPDLVFSIAEVESGFNRQAVGTLGERGLFQLRPEYFGEAATAPDLHHVDAAVRYLAHLRTLRSPTYGDAWFVFFNCGPSARITKPQETSYYKRVMTLYFARKASKNVSQN